MKIDIIVFSQHANSILEISASDVQITEVVNDLSTPADSLKVYEDLGQHSSSVGESLSTLSEDNRSTVENAYPESSEFEENTSSSLSELKNPVSVSNIINECHCGLSDQEEEILPEEIDSKKFSTSQNLNEQHVNCPFNNNNNIDSKVPQDKCSPPPLSNGCKFSKSKVSIQKLNSRCCKKSHVDLNPTSHYRSQNSITSGLDLNRQQDQRSSTFSFHNNSMKNEPIHKVSLDFNLNLKSSNGPCIAEKIQNGRNNSKFNKLQIVITECRPTREDSCLIVYKKKNLDYLKLPCDSKELKTKILKGNTKGDSKINGIFSIIFSIHFIRIF